MSIHAWHLYGVAVPYVLIATALWGLAAGAVKDAVAVGSVPARLRLAGVAVPTVPLAYALGFAAVAFIYGCALDRRHMGAALGADPHALAPGADAVLYGLAAVSWLSAALLIAPYRWLRRWTHALLAAPRERDAAEARYRLLADNLTDLVCHHSLDGRYEWVSPSAEALLGFTPGELAGTDPYDYIHPADGARIREEAHQRLLSGTASNTFVRYRHRHRDGHWVWLESLTETVYGRDGEVRYLQVTSRDVTERQAHEDDLRRRAHHDPLTGLANRMLFALRLDAVVAEAEAHFAVLYVDLDRFKAVNDTLGHEAGDSLLVQIGERLQRVTRAHDTAARIGGDEFAVLLTEVASEAEAIAAAERIVGALDRPFALGETARSVTASIGIVVGREGHASSGEVLREADLAAYATKRSGRAGWSVFTPEMRAASERRRRLEVDLERAVDGGELRVVYQPIVSLADGRTCGVEALVRWQHPQLGLLYPDVFISIAEETGRIAELDRWVMAEGLAQVEAWERALGRELDLTIAVNCSARDLHDPLFASSVRGLVAAAPRRRERLVLEVTESLLVDDPQSAAEVLESLRDGGVRFAMDDFGTGYSSLSVVHALPVDTIKADRAFVQRMHEDEAAMAMVRTVVGFAHTLGKRVVAEGIETRDQLEALARMGCEYGQGYLFAKPLAPDAVAELLGAEAPPWAGLWAEPSAEAAGAEATEA